ncbi:MAG: response regulator transcription factor, partial [Dehalococcoidia bacterium]
MNKIRVFLVDDHYVVCEGLRRMLEQEEELSVVGEAHTGEEALAKLRDTSADVVLLDVRLAGMDGIETLRELKASQPDLRVIMLTSYGDEYLSPSIEAGATGYLLKRANRTEMVKAIHEALQGGAPLDS